MKNTLKKILFMVWLTSILWAWTIWVINADNSFWNPNYQGENSWVRSWDTAHDLNVAARGEDYDSNKLIPTIKKFVNWILGMLSLIALVICLRGWFQMLTASGDESKYKKWFTILKQAAIALAVIWLSWLFVTLILYLINKSSE